ncbi:CoA-binding protein [Arcticibacterium luteifluviistationis]|uniref:CoA-binding protein n=1 Tax=Arcticibacterium luteifluviistationis TaxID=1784714 RepID=A0A2Z4GDG0_9BACT|nr:CoA-binding protein [Arcticibacterium luteifluviistationis]AWV99065.1 CoA-binding protein [Arcticibacterium luteifluviistationis]
MTEKNTLILGASTNPTRYSYLAANRLARHKHPITLVGIKKGEVAGEVIQNSIDGIENIHTVTMYLGERNQLEYEDFLLALNPKRVIFNPGAENPSLMKRLEEQGVETLEACTLVMLSTGQF